MNALFNHAIKQKSQLTKDLNRFEKNPQTAPISLQGSISATLVSFEKTIVQYEDYLNNQPKLLDNNNNNNSEQQQIDEKNKNRLTNLKNDLIQLQTQFRDLKKIYNDSTNQKNHLFSGISTSENPYNDIDTEMNQRRTVTTTAAQSLSQKTYLDGLQDEQSIFKRGNSQLDYILEMGQNSLNDIIEQNHLLDQIQNKLTKSLRTLNVSEGTIQSVNSRLFKDKMIFWIALCLLFLGMYLILKWLR
ncbi:protein transport protein bos1 [Maudiozyma exigua]|uniref:Protein transport protein BOS1 n=1 Tax=Maudiozyma exigua TaxID=34358 RepID=A0A9P6WC10_MAUEX|nr:protein transport protein bos1 [Kazachstania exigua]